MLTKAQEAFLLRDLADGEGGRLIYCRQAGDIKVARALAEQGCGTYVAGESSLVRRFKLSELGQSVRGTLLRRRTAELTGEEE